eukprot:1145125-Pelagomonas_calceolata.AAC.7
MKASYWQKQAGVHHTCPKHAFTGGRHFGRIVQRSQENHGSVKKAVKVVRWESQPQGQQSEQPEGASRAR